MRPTPRVPWILALSLAACSPARPTGDAGPDASHDADASLDATAPDAADAADAFDARSAHSIADLPIASTETRSGLDGAVDVVTDEWGWPHIYATTLHDAMYTQGLLEARDRIAQMELLRRSASGTLAATFGSLDPSLVDDDLSMRVLGLRRAAQASWDALPAGRTRDAMLAFAAGVNAFLADVRANHVHLPIESSLVVNATTQDWTPVDTLTIGRLEALSQSYLADEEIRATDARDRAAATFTAGATDPRLARRTGFFWDLYRFPSPSDTVVVPGFGAATGAHLDYRPRVFAPRLPRGTASALEPFFRGLHHAIDQIGKIHRGSNNFAVAGAHTASGHALLESDPHMTLPSPSLMWGVHLTVSEGPDALDAAGVIVPGLPGILLGFNQHVAWGMTNSFLDSVDAYDETITVDGSGHVVSTRLNGADVPVQTVTEAIDDGAGHTYNAPVAIVPHHGPVLPVITNHQIAPYTGTHATSVAWIGHRPSDEFSSLLGLMYATTVDEGRAALAHYATPPLNFVLADTAGHFAYSTQAAIPARAPGAVTWSPTNLGGTMPCLVLPGDGSAEWTGMLDSSLLPQASDAPDRPFIVTANNDPAGNSMDGNPFNDAAYLGCKWAYGFRAERITERLQALGDHVTLMDAQAIQNDHTELVAGRYRPFLAAALAHLQEERTTPGTHPDLTAFAQASMARSAQLTSAAATLAAWSLDTASGVESTATDAQRSDSNASMLFHGWLVRFLDGALGDELAAAGIPLAGYLTDQMRIDVTLAMLEHPDQLMTYDASISDSALWDDLRTNAVVESRDLVLVRALDEALTQLATRIGRSDVASWRWGELHTLRFTSMIPGPGSILDIPGMNDAMFPAGFPRPGGVDTVDAAEPGTDDFDFTYSEGPAQRFTVEMDPAGPIAFNALPGGQIANSASPHFRDEAELWRQNQAHPVPTAEADVIAHFEQRVRLAPGP